jgi:hypothetical protein
MIFPIPLKQHISKLLKYFWSNFYSVEIWAPYNAMLQMQQFTAFFLKCKSSWCNYETEIHLCAWHEDLLMRPDYKNLATSTRYGGLHQRFRKHNLVDEH